MHRREVVRLAAARSVGSNGWLSALLGALLALGCSQPPPAPPAVPEPPKPRRVHARLTEPLWVREVGFEAPESIVHDAEADLYLVSNIAGSPLSRDDRGFISRVRPDGSVAALKWIDAETTEVELHAPKGLALIGNTLYVADIDRVRSFDRATGRALGAVKVPGASFLNDLSAAPDGSLYVSDSGLGRGLTPTGNEAIYRIAPDRAVARLPGARALGQPSGLWAGADGLWVAGFGSGSVLRLDASGVTLESARPPKGSLDGLALFAGHVYVSSWEASAVFADDGESFIEKIGGLDSPADLAIDEPRSRLLITHYNQNAISIHQL